jgi:hypothetical protein
MWEIAHALSGGQAQTGVKACYTFFTSTGCRVCGKGIRMHRLKSRALLFGGLLGLLVGCGEVLGGAGISGTVSAPVGGDVDSTRVFACYENEPDCAMLGEVRIAESGTSAPYQLSSLPRGSYSVYALKEVEGEAYAGWYTRSNDPTLQPSLVTPPATGIDIRMRAFPDAERPSLPEEVRELSERTP